MRALAVATALFAATSPAMAADDPIAVRQALMRGNGAGAAIAGGVMRGQLEYNPVIGRASIAAMNAAAQAFGDYFPEGSQDPERSTAAPAIWEDREGFLEALDDFRTATAAAMEATRDDGPADAETFAAAVRPVLETCSGCHETYRLED